MVRLEPEWVGIHAGAEIGGAQRLIETVLDMPEFAARLDGNLSVGDLILNKQVVILDGAEAEPDSRTALYRAWNLMIFRFLAKNFAETGKAAPCLLVWDEAPATNCIGPMEINMLREGRKMGLAGWIAGQDLSFIDPILKKAVKSITPEHCWYNPGDDELSLEAAKDVGYSILNPYLVHHSTIQQRRLKPLEEIRISKTRGKSGDEERTSTTESTVLTPQYEDVEIPVYTALHEQILLTAQKVMLQRSGYRMINSPEYVTEDPEYSAMLKDPYPEDLFPGLKAKKVARAIAKSQARVEFNIPVMWEQPCHAPATTPSAKPAAIAPSKNLPKPRSPRGNKQS